MNKITVSATIKAATPKVWDFYTNPQHIVHWNFAAPTWHCPSAVNDLQVGGTYNARMEAKDGSFGFNFEAVYTQITLYKEFTYQFGDREAHIQFESQGEQTTLRISFDPETENPVELQRGGWQSILDNFKQYAETH